MIHSIQTPNIQFGKKAEGFEVDTILANLRAVGIHSSEVNTDYMDYAVTSKDKKPTLRERFSANRYNNHLLNNIESGNAGKYFVKFKPFSLPPSTDIPHFFYFLHLL